MFTFSHRFCYRDGTFSLPYRSTRSWKTSRGAMRAAEQHAKLLEPSYDMMLVAWHALAVIDLNTGLQVTSEAA